MVMTDTAPCPKERILVSEDDPSLQEIFELLLKTKGYEVQILSDARVVVVYGSLKADLFLLALHLSGYSGLDICRQLKAGVDPCNIPVIMMSAGPNIHTLAKSSGADESIEKPFDSKQLLATISFHLTREEIR